MVNEGVVLLNCKIQTMTKYPIDSQSLDKDLWTRKINATLMMSFQAEADTLPYL